jgi:hypothetical protein
MLYAEPFWERRKEEICVEGVLYRAVAQNSRKWKRESIARKKGVRHDGEEVVKRMYRDRVVQKVRALPRRRDRIAMPERDLGWPGRYCLS